MNGSKATLTFPDVRTSPRGFPDKLVLAALGYPERRCLGGMNTAETAMERAGIVRGEGKGPPRRFHLPAIPALKTKEKK